MVKSGRVSKMKGAIGTVFNLKPIVILNAEGKSETVGKPFTEKSSMKMAMKMVDRKLKDRELWGYAITHANNLKSANWYAEQMEQRTGMDAKFINASSPVLGVNVGQGVVALSLMFK